MNFRAFCKSNVPYLIMFAVALFLRLVKAGHPALNEMEASYALQALAAARGEGGLWSGQPGYLAITSALFYLFGSGNLLARFVPALAGSAVVVSPFLFKKYIGEREAFLLSVLLAFDPAGLALSRQAGGDLLAVSGLLLGLGFLLAGKGKLSGLFLGLGLLGGATAWLGMVIILTTLALVKLWWECEPVQIIVENGKRLWKELLVVLLVTIFLGSTLFFAHPNGLSAFGGSFSEFLRGFTRGIDNAPAIEASVFYVVAYYPLALVFGIWQGIYGFIKRDGIDSSLAIAFLVGLGIYVIYPGHTMGDLTWLSVPLWALAGRGLLRLIHIDREERLSIASMVALVVVLGVSAWLNVMAYADGYFGGVFLDKRLLAVLVPIILMILTTLLVGWGWTWNLAAKGLLSGAVVLLCLYSLGASVKSAGLGQVPCAEPWQQAGCFEEEGVFVKTIKGVSEWNVRSQSGIDVMVNGNSNAIRWALRDLSNIQFVSSVAVDPQPGIVVATEGSVSGIEELYSGQDFILAKNPNWNELSKLNYLRWLVYREIPATDETIITWVRWDLFPGASQNH